MISHASTSMYRLVVVVGLLLAVSFIPTVQGLLSPFELNCMLAWNASFTRLGPGYDTSLQDPNPCNWAPVTCYAGSNVQTLVYRYDFSQSSVNPLPGCLGNLTKLNTLDLSRGDVLSVGGQGLGIMTGHIPPFLDTSLAVLSLINMNLTGPIPALSHISTLQRAQFDSNSLTGTIPTTPSSCTYFSASNNQLSGPIPISLFTATNVYLNNNQLTGLPPVVQLPPITTNYMELCNNQLQGTIPRLITTGSYITWRFAHNALTGAFDFAQHTFSSTLEMDFSYNKLSGAVNTTMFLLNTYNALNLVNNELNSFIPFGQPYSPSYWAGNGLYSNPFRCDSYSPSFAGSGNVQCGSCSLLVGQTANSNYGDTYAYSCALTRLYTPSTSVATCDYDHNFAQFIWTNYACCDCEDTTSSQPCGTTATNPNNDGTCQSSCGSFTYGPYCKDCTQTCPHGVTCLSGPTGDGSCSNCANGWSNTDCNTPCQCPHGSCQNSIFGPTPECAACDQGYFNTTCQPCSCDSAHGLCENSLTSDGKCFLCLDGYYGVECDKPCTCLATNGHCNGSLSDDPVAGQCTSCGGARAGVNCDIDCCPHGNGNCGVLGDGSCNSCDAGYIPDGPFACAPCPGGFYAAIGATNCTPCEPGRISANGTSSCQACALGHIPTHQRTECDACAAGSTTYETDPDTCVPCSPGMSSAPTANGAQTCQPCAANTYSPTNGSLCLGCPVGGASLFGATSCSPAQGYKRDPNNANAFIQCPIAEACCPDGTCGPNCPVTTEVDGNFSTSTASHVSRYKGDFCQLCAAGNYSPNNDGHCEQCPSYTLIYILVAVAVLLIICILMVIAARSASFYMGSITVAYNFFQFTSILAGYNLQWPPIVLYLFNYISVFNLNIDILSVDCTTEGGLTYDLKWKAKLVLPLIILLIFVLIYIVSLLYKATERPRKSCSKACASVPRLRSSVKVDGLDAIPASKATEMESVKPDLGHASVNAALSMMSVLYVLMISTSMEPFDCVQAYTIPSGLIATKNNNRYVIRQGPLVDCYGDEWIGLRNLAIAGLAVYGAGVPLLFIAILLFIRKKLHHTDVIARFGLLYRRYRGNRSAWELIIMIRKVGVVLPVFFNYSGFNQLISILVIVFVSMVLQIIFRPYSSSSVNKLETMSIVCSFIVLLAGLAFYQVDQIYSVNVVANTAGNKFSRADFRSALGYVVVFLIALFSLVIVLAVFADLRQLYRMKSTGIVGCYATDKVTVFGHFFRSNFSVITPRQYVTTTNHCDDIALGYKSKIKTKAPISLMATVHANGKDPKYRLPPIEDNKSFDVDSESGSDAKALAKNDGSSILLQHDIVSREYHINMQFKFPGFYTMLLSGGKHDVKFGTGCCAKCCCCCKRCFTDRFLPAYLRQEKKDRCCECARTPIPPARYDEATQERLQHMMMEYVLEVTEEITVPLGQAFVDVSILQKHGGLIFSPTERFLPVGETQTFRVRGYNVKEVFVLQRTPGGRALANPTKLFPDKKERTFKNDRQRNNHELNLVYENKRRQIIGPFKKVMYTGDVTFKHAGLAVIMFVYEDVLAEFPNKSGHASVSAEFDTCFKALKKQRSVEVVTFEIVKDLGAAGLKRMPSSDDSDDKRRSRSRSRDKSSKSRSRSRDRSRDSSKSKSKSRSRSRSRSGSKSASTDSEERRAKDMSFSLNSSGSS